MLTLRLFVLVIATATVPLNADEPPARMLDLPLVFRDDFETGDPATRWEPSDPKAWKLTEQDGNKVWSQFQHIGNVLIYGNKATRPAGAM